MLGGDERLRRPLETFFLTRSRDDAVAVAPADLRTGGTVLVPERLEPGVESPQLVSDDRVMRLRELVPQLDPALALAIDFGVDLLQRSLHILGNAVPDPPIPEPAGRPLTRSRARPGGPRRSRSSARARGAR